DREAAPVGCLLVVVGHGKGEHAGGVAQAPHVAVEEERMTVIGPQRLVHALAVQNPVIEDRDRRVLLIDHAPVDVHSGGHRGKAYHSAALIQHNGLLSLVSLVSIVSLMLITARRST